MRTLLRKISTGLYFKGPDQWTTDPAQAHNFKLIDHAIRFVQNWDLKDVELAFAFDNFTKVKRVPLERMSSRYSED